MDFALNDLKRLAWRADELALELAQTMVDEPGPMLLLVATWAQEEVTLDSRIQAKLNRKERPTAEEKNRQIELKMIRTALCCGAAKIVEEDSNVERT